MSVASWVRSAWERISQAAFELKMARNGCVWRKTNPPGCSSQEVRAGLSWEAHTRQLKRYLSPNRWKGWRGGVT